MSETQIVIRFANQLSLRCNKRCWNSTSNHCHCACSGVNHGIGAKAVQEKTAKQLTLEIQAQYPNDPPKVTIIPGQLFLF